MCRYGGLEKKHMACFNCRIALKNVPTCPHCQQPMVSMGLDFKAPKRSEIKQWKKVEILYKNGIRFGGCGCSGPGYRPKELSEVEHFLSTSEEINRRKSDGQKLLEKFDRFAGLNRS